MLQSFAILGLALVGSQALFAQSDGSWKFSARKEWKYAFQPGRTDARAGQNMGEQSISYSYEYHDVNGTGRWLRDDETFKWDMFDPANLMISILPKTGNERLTPGQKVRLTGTMTFAGQYNSNGSGSIYVGEPPLQTPAGWRSATELYPTWGYRTDAVLYIGVGNNSTQNGVGDFVVPKGPTTGPASFTIRCVTGIKGSAAIEYVYDWVGPSPPTVTGVTHNTTGQRSITSGGWFSVWGSGFASNSRSWGSADFSGRNLPTALDGVQVLVHGRPALISFISPGQINALAPSDTYIGDVDVQVVTPNGLKSPNYTVALTRYSPGFFLYSVASAKYPVAHVGSEFIGKAGLITGLLTRPAKPGETITLYGTGFGPAATPFAPETTVTGYSEIASPTTFTIGGVSADVLFAGQTGSGLYQFNMKIPTVPGGDQKLVATIGGVPSPSDILISIQN
jgi:uncharacterized protein (TIGR03437 family)